MIIVSPSQSIRFLLGILVRYRISGWVMGRCCEDTGQVLGLLMRCRIRHRTRLSIIHGNPPMRNIESE